VIPQITSSSVSSENKTVPTLPVVLKKMNKNKLPTKKLLGEITPQRIESTTRKRKFNTLVKRVEDGTEKEVQVPAQQNAEMYMAMYNRWTNRIMPIKVDLKQYTHEMYNYYIYNYKTYRSVDLSL
jgi:hypothetical protein